jgi:Ran-binding protein 1
MKLQPNIGSDRSWVWKVAADYSEEPPTSETLAIRFANADSWCTRSSLFAPILMLHLFPVAVQFKKAFESAQDNNAKLAGAPPPYTPEEKREETTESGAENEDEDEGEGEGEGNAPAPSETNPPAGESQESEKKDEE